MKVDIKLWTDEVDILITLDDGAKHCRVQKTEYPDTTTAKELLQEMINTVPALSGYSAEMLLLSADIWG